MKKQHKNIEKILKNMYISLFKQMPKNYEEECRLHNIAFVIVKEYIKHIVKLPHISHVFLNS